MISDEGYTFIALAGLTGINPMFWLKCEDDVEQTYMRIVAEKMIKYAEQQRKNLAFDIVHTLAKAMTPKGSSNAR